MNSWKKKINVLLCTVLLTACSSPVFLTKNPVPIDEKQTEISKKQHLPKGFFPIDLNIVAIGDSLTQGVGDETKKGGYVPHVVEFISDQRAIDNVRVSNLGKRGNRTDQLLARLKEEEIAAQVSRADLVFVTIGGNDVMKVVRDFFYNISLDTFKAEQIKYESRLNRVLKQIRKINPDAHVYLIGFYNPFFHSLSNIDEVNMVIDSWNSASERVASKHENVIYVRVDDIFYYAEENLLGKDEFHPNQKGYELMAERISQYIKREEPLMQELDLEDDNSLVEGVLEPGNE